MPKIVLAQKDPSSTYSQVFDFSSFILASDTITSAVTTCVVYSGTDASPSALISGSATISGFQVTQKLTGGVNGTTYTISCTATCTSGAILILSGYLATLQTTL